MGKIQKNVYKESAESWFLKHFQTIDTQEIQNIFLNIFPKIFEFRIYWVTENKIKKHLKKKG